MSFCVNPYGLVLAALKAEEEDGRVNKLMNKIPHTGDKESLDRCG